MTSLRKLFPLIDEICVPRCYIGGLYSRAYEIVHLHLFNDASDEAYGCVACFRLEYDAVVHCAFIEARAQVTSLQYLPTPRIEVEASVLMKAICKAYSFPNTKRFIGEISTLSSHGSSPTS